MLNILLHFSLQLSVPHLLLVQVLEGGAEVHLQLPDLLTTADCYSSGVLSPSSYTHSLDRIIHEVRSFIIKESLINQLLQGCAEIQGLYT